MTPVCLTAVYKPHCDQTKREIERIQKEENMSLPQDIDYLTLPVSLSQEVREILDRFRPSTVSQLFIHVSCIFWILLASHSFVCPFKLGAATRLEGMTPAAVVTLFNYVNVTGKRESVMNRNQAYQEDEGEEDLCTRNLSLPQWESYEVVAK